MNHWRTTRSSSSRWFHYRGRCRRRLLRHCRYGRGILRRKGICHRGWNCCLRRRSGTSEKRSRCTCAGCIGKIRRKGRKHRGAGAGTGSALLGSSRGCSCVRGRRPSGRRVPTTTAQAQGWHWKLSDCRCRNRTGAGNHHTRTGTRQGTRRDWSSLLPSWTCRYPERLRTISRSHCKRIILGRTKSIEYGRSRINWWGRSPLRRSWLGWCCCRSSGFEKHVGRRGHQVDGGTQGAAVLVVTFVVASAVLILLLLLRRRRLKSSRRRTSPVNHRGWFTWRWRALLRPHASFQNKTIYFWKAFA